MAAWPSKPTWINPDSINSGQEFTLHDGIRAFDINTIIKNLIYLRQNAGGGGGGGGGGATSATAIICTSSYIYIQDAPVSVFSEDTITIGG